LNDVGPATVEAAREPVATEGAANPYDQGVNDESASAPEAGEPREYGPVLYVFRAALIVVATATLGFVLFLTVGSGIKHRASQASQFDKFRNALALGTAPVGPLTADGKHLLAFGTPVAYLQIPALHVHQVVGEGTTAAVLAMGPGHLRDSPLPGQPGVSVIFGRAAAYGGPFKHLKNLRAGQQITVRTGVGASTFKVRDVRVAGDKVPLPPSNGSRLVLTTATGPAFMPNGLLYVDADLTSAVLPASPQVLTAPDLRSSERANASDTSSLWKIVLCLQALCALAVGMVWAWVRWGHYQALIAFVPPVLLANLVLSDQLARLLPSLM
jgi:LPXTG-site transpeptidase (sortase) family protein